MIHSGNCLSRMIGKPNRRSGSPGRFGAYASILIVAGLFMGCTATGYLKEGESFYSGPSIIFNTHGRVSGRNSLKSELEEMITPKPNSKFLCSRISGWIYYRIGGERDIKGM